MSRRATDSHPFPSVPLADIALGDIVTTPDGRSLTVRSKVVLPEIVGDMAGFVICGELETLLATPATASSPIDLYVPSDYFPYGPGQYRLACEGAANYWAPHLPALRGAMGELLWQVFELRGSTHPAVVVHRGDEYIVFVRASGVWPDSLRVTYMRRDVDNDVDVVRRAALVEVPALAPAATPVPTRRRQRVLGR